jgi:hypothetical protein
MEPFVLPLLTITIVIAIIWCSTRWLGKKEQRALTRFSDAQDPHAPVSEEDGDEDA